MSRVKFNRHKGGLVLPQLSNSKREKISGLIAKNKVIRKKAQINNDVLKNAKHQLHQQKTYITIVSADEEESNFTCFDQDLTLALSSLTSVQLTSITQPSYNSARIEVQPYLVTKPLNTEWVIYRCEPDELLHISKSLKNLLPGIKRCICITFETSELHQLQTDIINKNFDLCLTTSEFCHDVLTSSGTMIPIVVVDNHNDIKDYAHYILTILGRHDSKTHFLAGKPSQLESLGLRAPICRHDGYGSFAFNMVQELSSREIDFGIFPTWKTQETIAQLTLPATRALDNCSTLSTLVNYSVPTRNDIDFLRNDLAKNGTAISFTMFETNHIPEIMVDGINFCYDSLFTPSDFCTRVFYESGVRVPVYTIGHGINPIEWPYCHREKTAQEEGRPFRFFLYANGFWDILRKNYQLTYDSFIAAFERHQKVELILKVNNSDNLPVNIPFNVKVIDGHLSQEKLVQVLNQVDCLVFASSGEGFGLPPREAMSTGLPVIVANWGALSTLGSVPGLCYPVPVNGLKPARYTLPFLTGENTGEFADVKKEDLVEVMRQVYRDQRKALEVGSFAAKWVRENETTKHVIDRMLKVIQSIKASKSQAFYLKDIDSFTIQN